MEITYSRKFIGHIEQKRVMKGVNSYMMYLVVFFCFFGGICFIGCVIICCTIPFSLYVHSIAQKNKSMAIPWWAHNDIQTNTALLRTHMIDHIDTGLVIKPADSADVSL